MACLSGSLYLVVSMARKYTVTSLYSLRTLKIFKDTYSLSVVKAKTLEYSLVLSGSK